MKTMALRIYRAIRYPPALAKDLAESRQLYSVMEAQQEDHRVELSLVEKELRDWRQRARQLRHP
jgi:hypothetical protein